MRDEGARDALGRDGDASGATARRRRRQPPDNCGPDSPNPPWLASESPDNDWTVNRGFVQIIEFRTSKIDEMRAIGDEWETAAAGDR